jgi:glycosyltransferase involved in cell wall biosynthesis
VENRILGIEKSEILLNNLAKFLHTKMDVINIPSKNRDFLLFEKPLKKFKSKKLSEQINELNSIKNNYNLCIVSSWYAAKLAFLCNMNYIFYFIGDDIRNPPLLEKIISNDDLDLDFLKKQSYSYQDVFNNAITCVTGSEELFNLLKSFRSDSIRIDRTIVTPNIFNRNLQPVDIKKNKFTFFCPTRIGSEKGIDILWKAIKLCNTDFEILQINWLDTKNLEIQKESEEILQEKPYNVYLIDSIKHEDMGRYYRYADCILGEMKTGHTNSIEREAALCHKPVLNYNDNKTKSFMDGKELITPFLPQSNEPIEIAKIIDRIVIDKEFRESLADKEYNFMKNLTDPQKTAMEWDNLIKKTIDKLQN